MKISVIMPTYNRAFCISESIDSVLSQDICKSVSVELVIVDDCSTDNTYEIVKPYLSDSVIYYRNDVNKGGAESRNIGVSKSTGEYLSFIDSDIIWYHNKLSTEYNKISDKKEVIYCKYRKQVGNNWIIMPKNCKDGEIYKHLLFDNFVDTPSVLLSREVFEKSEGFDSLLPRFQDWDLFLNISKFSSFVLVDDILYDSKTFQNSITHNDNARLEALLHIYSKYKSSILNDKNLLMRFLFKIINSFLLLGEKKKAFNFIIEEKHNFIVRIKILTTLAFLSLIPTNFYIYLFRLR